MQKKWGIKKIAEAPGIQGESKSGLHNCDSTLKKVMLSLDNEMSEEDEKQFLDEINQCSYCLEKFNIEKSFKEYLCGKIRRRAVPLNLADQIRAHIRHTTEG
ncbi:MAG: hypothetical protein ABIQ74_05150 [Chitinophagales bacterium]